MPRWAAGCSRSSVALQCEAMNWLVKEEPTHYGFDELVNDTKAAWSGVKNALAQKHLRAVKNGDRILYYHTGDERAVVRIARLSVMPVTDAQWARIERMAAEAPRRER